MSDPAFDLVIRGGTVIDGTGAPAREADVAIAGGRIAAIGPVAGAGREEIDARGRIVTPGFVDIHSHYDGHVTWADHLDPSSPHGVTTVVTGNCGVGFAPCRPEDRERLITLMEGVEDIPEPVLAAGLPWCWESFPQYMDFIASRRFDMDVAVQVPHAPLRVHAMGERAARREAATDHDIAAMRALAAEALAAGAIGFSTSRSLNHRGSDGELTPSYDAGARELVAIAGALKDAGRGVWQMICDLEDEEGDFALIRQVAAASGRPLSLSLMQYPHDPQRWRRVLDRIEQANADGLAIRAQVCGRPVGQFYGLDFSRHPFAFCDAYREVAALPLPQRLAALRDPARRARILGEFPGTQPPPGRQHHTNFANIFECADLPDYEPAPDESLGARAALMGVAPQVLAYDLITRGHGETVFYNPVVNFAGNSIAAVRAMLASPHAVLGLGDGGAHCGFICDASLPTHMLTRWARSGEFPLERIVQRLTSQTAQAVGLTDRGVLRVGARADANVIDYANLKLPRPFMVPDLPLGGARIAQDPAGYDATLVAGVITRREGRATGQLPGRLIRH
ncbi:amidohydrolase family protein [Novosphingobium bradum]|uniref:Amidohydrolase family protein n=1 Tax=Novosphingobium bradum TaxID=1737444 RepID=A0ABV7IQM0_9SPHN